MQRFLTHTLFALFFVALVGSCNVRAVRAGEPVWPELSSSRKAMMPLEDGWARPPRIARMRCWWWWLNGNVTRAAITRDLEQMKAKGYGGANVIDAGGAEQGGHHAVPHGPDFATPEWRKLFTFALAEADRLGLELGFNILSGWNLGGPGVLPEHAAKKLTWSETDVDGGHRLTIKLAQPKGRDGFYRDVAVVAFPVQRIASATQATVRVALYNGRQRVTPNRPTGQGIKYFEEKAYYKLPGRFSATKAWHLLDTAPASPDDMACRSKDVLNLTRNLKKDGTLDWDVPAGRWKILRFGYTITGAMVSTHSDGWAGLAIDYLDRDAFESYWQRVMIPILADAKPYIGRSLRFLHTDSWELGPVNWTPKMPAQFRRLRGYDMTRYLPVMANYIVDSREVSTRFLNDLRRTLADLIATNDYIVFARHAHALGMGIHPESGGPHAAPIDALMNLGISDLPMGEFWARAKTHRVKDDERFFVKQTSSAAHIYGKRIALAEAFTSIGPQWERDPRMLKPTFDRAACEGHNLTMWHTFDCSPPEMGLPGQDYFAGTHLNPQVTWWDQAGAFIGYLNRCQFVLQQGLPVSDVLYYYGENIPSFVRLKRDDPAGVLPGYDYDVTDTTALLTRTRVDPQGRIVLPDGTSYHLLSLTPHNAISLATLEHIAQLVQQGATVVGQRPTRQYSLTGAPASDVAFGQLVDTLWGKPPGNEPRVVRHGKGRMISGKSARAILHDDGVGPDFTWTRGDSHTLLDYVHRATDDADIYYVVNRNDRPEDLDVLFRVRGRRPELWDPITGDHRDATQFHQEKGHTAIPMRLAGEQSVFVVFREPVDLNAAGTGEPNFPDYEPRQTIDGPWPVHFDPARRGPKSVVFAKLVDWTRRPEPAIRYYAGPATYTTTFTLPKDAGSSGTRWMLDLGNVKNLADVRLNGTELGVVWMAPFRIDISAAARSGVNRLEVKIVNLWPNRLIGDQQLPRAERRTRTNITKFKKDSPLLPSGLLGPVRILAPTD